MSDKNKAEKAKRICESFSNDSSPLKDGAKKDGAKVDREASVIKDVLLLGPTSKNGNVYPSEARKAALPLFEGARVNLSHEKRFNPVSGKYDPITAVDYPRRFGKVFNIRDTDSGLRGDLKCLKSHAFTSTIMEAAEEMPDLFSFSPVMDVISASDNVHNIVTIPAVYSVDIVTDGGTTRTIYEEAPAESPEVHEEELEEAEEVEEPLQLLIDQITMEIKDFHSNHKDADKASSRVGSHIRHHAKMHLKEEKEGGEEEKGPEEKKEEEEYKLLKAEKAARRICEEKELPITTELLDVLARLPSDDAREKHVIYVKRQSILNPTTPAPAPAPDKYDSWTKVLQMR